MSEAIVDHDRRVAAALRGALAAHPPGESGGAAHDMLVIAESLAERGVLDVDDIRQRHLPPAGGAALLVRVLPFGLATPLDRPRLRRDAYRCAAATGADEGSTIVCVAAALVIADLMRFDPVTTAIRVRQSLLEDAPMALLDRVALLDPGSDVAGAREDPGAALQLALSAISWTDRAGVGAVLERLGEDAGADTLTLAAALAGAASGECDLPLHGSLAERADRAAAALYAIGTPAPLAPL